VFFGDVLRGRLEGAWLVLRGDEMEEKVEEKEEEDIFTRE
jgi:hypothetical protein